MFTDPISDMLTRIRNASAVRKTEVIIPFSKIKLAIAQILEREGFVEKIENEEEGVTTRKDIRIHLKYNGRIPVINGLDRVSKPGRRLYVNQNNLPKIRNGMGIAIISTSQGLVTNKEAHKRKLGGEVICEVY